MSVSLRSIGGDLGNARAPGSADEIEDVVIVEQTGCILGSAKSKLVREDVARHARSRTALLDWYDNFFFAERKGRYQPGAVRLLDRKIREVRACQHKPRGLCSTWKLLWNAPNRGCYPLSMGS